MALPHFVVSQVDSAESVAVLRDRGLVRRAEVVSPQRVVGRINYEVAVEVAGKPFKHITHQAIAQAVVPRPICSGGGGARYKVVDENVDRSTADDLLAADI